MWGPMGVGKSSVGAALARELARPFFDLDRCIEASAQRSIPQIFASEGEAGFRDRERVALEQLLAAQTPSVIALGGGTLLDLSLCDHAMRSATVLGLTVDTPTLIQRLSADPTERPLFDQSFAERMRARSDAYATRHWAVSTLASVASVASCLADRVRAGLAPIAIDPRCGYAIGLTHEAARAVAEVISAQDITSVFVVTDSNVASLHADRFVSALSSSRVRVATTLCFPAGEAHKTLDTARTILRGLTEAGADRGSLLIGLGGGVVTDLTGFVASIFLRGVRWLAVPTTTMGMADAATGGKTGVDLDFGKNLVGAIHHPAAVIVDSQWSSTETDRAVRSGLAEVIKIAAVADATLFQWLEDNVARLRTRDPAAIATAISRSACLKARFVESDPKEQRGIRALLNFGHTMGHALESAELARASSLGEEPGLTHGEAISIGMVLACRLGERVGVASPADRLVRLLEALGLPVLVPDHLRAPAADLVTADKKRFGAALRFVLLEEVGRARLRDVPLDGVRAFLTTARANP